MPCRPCGHHIHWEYLHEMCTWTKQPFSCQNAGSQADIWDDKTRFVKFLSGKRLDPVDFSAAFNACTVRDKYDVNVEVSIGESQEFMGCDL
jgi:hypothetical protein